MMRILYCTHTSEQYVGCAVLSDEQVVCGPNWRTKHSEKGYTHIQTPAGRFDIKVIIDMLPAHQKPEMIVVWADSSCVAQPYNLGGFSGPKVLLIADTHHMERPIEKVIAYAKSEPWDFLVAFDNRHHLHFFREAGCKNIFWLPGLNSLATPMDFNIKRNKVITFVGQVGKFHPRRKAFLTGLQQAGVPLAVLQIPGMEALQAYSNSLISLECTLNSNIGLRTFEVLSAGGLLLADRPSMHSGMDLLFEDGKHLIYYDSFDDLAHKIKYLLEHPEQACSIALAGYKEFWAHHSPERKSQELMDLVWNGKVNPKYDLSLEPRMKRSLQSSGQSFDKRLRLYQHVQELHRNQEQVKILYDNQYGEYDVVEDLLDLPRVQCGIVRSTGSGQGENEVQHSVVDNKRCYFVDDTYSNQTWDLRIVSPARVQESEVAATIPSAASAQKIIVYTDDPCFGGAAQFDHAITIGLKQAGYHVCLAQTYNEDERVKDRERHGIRHLWLDYDTIKEFGRTLQQTDEPLRFFHEEQPDLIIFSNCCPFSNFAAKGVALQFGIPFIEVEHSGPEYLVTRFPQLLDERERLYKEAQAVITVSQANLMVLRNLFRLQPDKGNVIYPGRADAFFLQRDETVGQKIRAELNIPRDGVVFFTAARLDSLKGYDLQLMAIERLRNTKVWPFIYFIWAGGGNQEDYLRQWINDRQLSNKVYILGQRGDISELLNAADVFFLPSRLESFGLAAVEAMAKSLPVISTHTGGIPEALGDTGILLPDPNKEEAATVVVAAAMLELVATDKELRQVLGSKCYQRAKQLFSEEVMLAELIKVIEKATPVPKPLSTPKVSVIMPVYNAEEHLREAIDSIIQQTFIDYEFIIVYDESKDDSLGIIQSYNDERIKLIRNETKMGIVAALNKGISAARGQYIARMDADDISLPERLSRQVAYLDQHQEVAVCGTWLQTIGDRAGEIWGSRAYPTDGKRLKCLLLFHCAVAHPTVMMRRSLFTKERNYHYPEEYRLGAEDYKLWTQIARDLTIVNLPEILFHYRISDHQASTKSIGEQQQISGKVQFEMLQALGINPTAEQFSIHQAIRLGQIVQRREFIEAAGEWFIKLQTANDVANYYPEPEFTQVLREHWQMVCGAVSSQLGEWVIDKYRQFDRLLEQHLLR